MHLINGVSVVVCKRIPAFFGLFLLDIGVVRHWITQWDISIEPGGLKFDQLVLGFTHYVRDSLSALYIRGTVRHDYVLRRYENSYLPSDVGVKIHFLER